MLYMLATYQIMSMTALNLTVGLMFNSIDQEVIKDILQDVDEEENRITIS